MRLTSLQLNETNITSNFLNLNKSIIKTWKVICSTCLLPTLRMLDGWVKYDLLLSLPGLYSIAQRYRGTLTAHCISVTSPAGKPEDAGRTGDGRVSKTQPAFQREQDCQEIPR